MNGAGAAKAAAHTSSTGKTPLIFGYGSLIFKPMPHSRFVADGFVTGFARRYWQLSPDHRGTPEEPGRVCTVVEVGTAHALEQAFSSSQTGSALTVPERDGVDNLEVWGRVYEIAPEHAAEVIAALDHREKAGYDADVVRVHCLDGITREAMLYHANEHNQNFGGPETPAAIAAHILQSKGPSGKNIDYFTGMFQDLLAMPTTPPGRAVDPHLRAIWRELEALLVSGSRVPSAHE